jgi:hypothetical protein
MAFKPSKRPSSPATRREQRKASGIAALDAGRYRDIPSYDNEPDQPVVDKFKKVLKQPFTREKGISELFGDTEMGFDFLRRSKFNPRMQAGLRDSRPMSEYITFAPGDANPSSNRYASGVYSRPDKGLYVPGEGEALSGYTIPLSSSASEVLGMATPRTALPGTATLGQIGIDTSQSPRDQTRTLVHELLHKGGSDIMLPFNDTQTFNYGQYGTPIRQVGEDTNNRTEMGLTPEGDVIIEDTEHKDVQSATNKAFMQEDITNPSLMLKEMNRQSELYLTPDDKIELTKKITETLGSDNGVVARLPQIILGEDWSPQTEEQLRMTNYSLTTEDIATAYKLMTDMMADAPTTQEMTRVMDKNARIRQGAQNFANRFASGGIISALMEDAVT